MTVTIAFSGADDGYLTSTSATYSVARAGTGSFSVDTASGSAGYGQDISAGTYKFSEAFLKFAYAPAANEVTTGAAFRFYHASTSGASVARDLEVRQSAWVSPLTSASFRPGNALSTIPLLAVAAGVNAGNGKLTFAGSTALMDLLESGAQTVSVVLTSSRQRSGTTPTVAELSFVASSESSGTTNDPALVSTSVARSTLFGVLGAQVTLSDGSWAVLTSDGAASPTINLRRYTDAMSSALIAAIPMRTTFADPVGAQNLALVVDASDNLYVLGQNQDAPISISVRTYKKNTGGWTWAAGVNAGISLPAYTGPVNQVVAAWNATGGAGTLLVVAGHAPGTGISGATGSELAYVSLDCAKLLSGVAGAAMVSGGTPGRLLPQNTPTSDFYYATYTNETGAVLDVASAGDGVAVGYVASPGKDSVPGVSAPVGVGRYEVDATGAVTGVYADAISSWSLKDASAKVRLVPVGPTTAALVNADQDPTWGLVVVVFQVSASGWTGLGSGAIRLSNQGITSMPTESVLARSLAWDAVYVPHENKLWIYYPDATDPRIIRKTGVNLSTYQATKEETVVATVGAAGGTNLAIRVARQAEVPANSLVTVAHRSSGGVLSTVYVADSFNVAPTEPTLIPAANFDATQASVLAWTFNDPNLGDSQKSRQVQIIDASTGTTVVDTGKVLSSATTYTVTAGTLVNDKTYQWRVMVWDQGDVASPWSSYGLFSTGAGGSVSITVPATDNPAGLITDDILITWVATGTVAAKRRATVTRNDTGVLVGDTGWQAAAGTTGQVLISGMVSDVEHTITVQVENSLAVRSAVGSRRVTPSFSTPDAPVAVVQAVVEGGYILVGVNNPIPTGDRPAPTLNRVYRRLAGSGEDYVVVAEMLIGESYRDYEVASGLSYQYQVEAVV